jgi:cyclopropane fatty-acyl-phospholipid synthase-like methyltransferase
MTTEQIQSTVRDCLGDDTFANSLSSKASPETAAAVERKEGDEKWQWFDGDINAYYNSLEKDHKRDPNKLADYAIHRWLGPKRSTEQQYVLLDEAAMKFIHPANLADPVHVLDGGCGLGSGLMWMEQHHPTWNLEGYTLSEDQYSFIEKLPKHNFKVHLQSYNDLEPNSKYDFIYSIEALIHSPNATRTMEIWASHLNPGGVMAILDDFVVNDNDKQTEDMQEFAKSWLANSLFSTKDLGQVAKLLGMEVVQDRDLVEEFDIIGLNYRNKKPDIHPFGGRVHQGWMGSKWRQRLTVDRKLTYNLLVLKKVSNGESVEREARRMTSTDTAACEVVSRRTQNEPAAEYTLITPQLMSGRGKNGGEKIECISGWYCCNKGAEWWDQLDKGRTDNTAFLKLDRDLFGHYIDSFARHLNDHFSNHPSGNGGRFLDIGGTGSTASGMTQVTSKFQHFAGPLEYWKLDSDPAANGLERTLFCDIEDCPSADTCGFDVTFSHTVLEHATHPWLAFDTIARITKQGGLTMHLVPFSYQYHATPDDNYRFSHKALTSLLEDRGFKVLEVGYDICTKPENMRKRVDEHYDTIWLTYVIATKL